MLLNFGEITLLRKTANKSGFISSEQSEENMRWKTRATAIIEKSINRVVFEHMIVSYQFINFNKHLYTLWHIQAVAVT